MPGPMRASSSKSGVYLVSQATFRAGVKQIIKQQNDFGLALMCVLIFAIIEMDNTLTNQKDRQEDD